MNTPSLVKPRLPRGLQDQRAQDLRAMRLMSDAIRQTYELYGYEPLETPLFEYTDVLGKFLPDQDRPNEGVFSFLDDDEQWLSLRYDLTAPLARFVAEKYDQISKPYRSYRQGPVFRNEKPGPGRFRQFMQFDADIVGTSLMAADAEMCMMAADTMRALGIPEGAYCIKVNNRKILDGVLELAGIQAHQHLTVLRAIDKWDRLGVEGVRLLLGAGRKDESGDFTKGAGLEMPAIDRILAFVDARQETHESTLARLEAIVAGSQIGQEGVEELRQISALCVGAGYDGQIVLDPSVVRGLEYYTGPVFEADLSFDIRDDKGRPMRFGSVGGGGRYDGLIARFRAEPVPATGFSIGLSRLYAALKAIESPVVTNLPSLAPVLILTLDKEELPRYLSFARDLRRAGIPADVYMGQAGMNAQLKYADRRGCACVVIQGSQEREAAGGSQVVVKDLRLGAQLAAMTKDRTDYLALREKVQASVLETELVAHIREVLARPLTT